MMRLLLLIIAITLCVPAWAARPVRTARVAHPAHPAHSLRSPVAVNQPPTVGDFENNPQVETFIAEVAERDQFDADQLRQWFKQAHMQRGVLHAVTRQATPRPWFEYRAAHVGAARVNAGVKYWQRNAAALARASAQYGVSEEIIVATLGIETSYGNDVGKFTTFDALTTLAFSYPERAELFRGELEQLLLLAREHNSNPLRYRGSYAGALGVAQFLPSSYRRYAVDFDGDGKRDLWNDADAIGSVAHYYQEYGWRAGEAVTMPLQQPDGNPGADARSLMASGIKPNTTVAAVAAAGLTSASPLPDDTQVSVFPLITESGERYWLGLNNFYVITRYNHSNHYAMAVYELAQQLRSARNLATASQPVQSVPVN